MVSSMEILTSKRANFVEGVEAEGGGELLPIALDNVLFLDETCTIVSVRSTVFCSVESICSCTIQGANGSVHFRSAGKGCARSSPGRHTLDEQASP